MRSATILLLIGCVGVLSVLLYSQTIALREQRRQVQELNATKLDLQEKCAKQAHEAFKLRGFERKTTVWPAASVQGGDFSNHYNQRLNKCFVLIRDSYMDADARLNISTLYDAFEGKRYAHFSSVKETQKGKKDPEVTCTVTLLSGEKKPCHSHDEFEAVVKQYME